MKPVEFLGLAIFAAVQYVAIGSALCAVVAWLLFAVWAWASFISFKRQNAAEVSQS